MAQALIPNFIKESTESKGSEFYIFTPSGSKAKKFANDFGINFVADLEELRNTHIDFLWCAFKPQQLEQVSREVAFLTHPYLTIVSLLAGSDCSSIQQQLGSDQIIRIMPNTPAQVGLGVNALFKSKSVHKDKWDSFWSSFNTQGVNHVFDTEEDIDTITPYSGSGPAYFFEIARILIEDLSRRGINEALAHKMIGATIEGAGRMLSSHSSARQLRDNVTSKNGVTFEVLESLKNSGLENSFNKALECGVKRTLELKDSK